MNYSHPNLQNAAPKPRLGTKTYAAWRSASRFTKLLILADIAVVGLIVWLGIEIKLF
jgi:hypothetical protein